MNRRGFLGCFALFGAAALLAPSAKASTLLDELTDSAVERCEDETEVA